MANEVGPEYRLLMDDIRKRITSGEYPVGKPIPATPKLGKQAGVSITVVRRAVTQLQAEGILEGHPGKGVFVRALPEDADGERLDLRAAGEQLTELQREMDEIRSRIGRMEAIIVNLTKRSGLPNPFGGEHDEAGKAARRGRAG